MYSILVRPQGYGSQEKDISYQQKPSRLNEGSPYIGGKRHFSLQNASVEELFLVVSVVDEHQQILFALPLCCKKAYTMQRQSHPLCYA
jgi:hypothetical protein